MNFFKQTFLVMLVLYCYAFTSITAQSFTPSGLGGESLNNPTSLQFGPDGRLYVSQQNGTILAYTVVRNGANNYDVTNTETINLVKNIQNHNDDGSLNNNSNRQVTGLLLAGTANTPILYVSSSDSRIGGGGGGSDQNLDTNSGVISKLTKNGNNWTKVDLVRGLPRSEENHACNGMQLDFGSNTLYLAQGGHTNAGAPSNNFAFTTEYALSAAILEIDLDAIEQMSLKTDPNSGEQYRYNLPTLDDPTRPNVNGNDVNDPFGGNDGLNQAKLVAGGPVQIYASGFRNAYDVVLTQNGNLYTWDNGANGGWGGHPANEGFGTATNNWIAGEPGSNGAGPNDPQVNNEDGLHFISNKGYYGGHPNPIRANPAGAGLFTHDPADGNGGNAGVWRTNVTGNINTTLPSDWPPVPNSLANPIEGDFQNAGETDNSIYTVSASTNGMAEYTASNFGNALKGNLLAASFNGNIYSVNINNNGSINNNGDVSVLASGFGSTPLDVIAQGDNDPFPGTIWAATYGSDNITVFEPTDFNTPINPPSNNQGAIYINAGGPAVSTGGINWQADQYFLNGNSYSSNANIAGTNNDAIYQSERWNPNLAYQIPVENGTYTVELHFAEIWSGAQNAGVRVFDVSLEGDQVLNNYDISADVGYLTATVESFTVTVNDGQLNINFGQEVQNPKISGIALIPNNPTTPPTPTQADIYINSGGPAVTNNGINWQADEYFLNGNAYSTNANIAGTNNDAIYQSERWNLNLAYQIPVDNGTYTVELHFAEIWSGAQNGAVRIFDVSLEGNQVLNNYDIFDDVGFNTATIKSYTVTVNDGQLNINFGSVQQNPKISGIAVLSAGNNPPTPPPTTCSGIGSNTIDEDGDGYSNGDELANGTNPCNAADAPQDFDQSSINGFKVSNLNDPDDDDDGINDNQDFFAWDASNGQNTSLPINYPFLNGDPGFGFFGLGFTGLMSNGNTDYLDLIEEEDNSNTEIIAGGAVGLFTLNNVLDGDPYKQNNSQKNGFQFGIDVNSSTNSFAIESGLLGPVFVNTPTKHESVGIYIGTGDQNNYLKVTVYANSGNPAIQVLHENNGQIQYVQTTPIPNIGSASEVKLRLKVSPNTGQVQAQYAIGNAAPQNVADQIQLAGATLQALQANNQSLAVGIISTSIGSNLTMNATWDYLNIDFEDAPRLDDAYENWINIFPNPSKGFLNLDLSEFMETSIRYRLTDVSGKLLKEGIFAENHNTLETIDLAGLQNGIYFLHFKPGIYRQFTRKVMLID